MGINIGLDVNQTVAKLMTETPSMSPNELIRTVWKIDIDTKAVTIIRSYYKFKSKTIKIKKVKSILLPDTLSHSKVMTVRDMEQYGIILSFDNFRKYGISAEEIYEIEKINGWGIHKNV